MMKITTSLSAGLLALLAASCSSTIDRRIDPDSPDAVGGAGLDSQDIRTMADTMARDILAANVLVSPDPGERISFYVLGLENQSSQPMNRDIIVTQIRTQIQRTLGRDVQVLDRSGSTLAEVKKEREAKRSGAVTSKEGRQKGLAGSDYVLTGVIMDQVKQSGSLKSAYFVVNYKLVDLESSEIVWTNDYDVKFESEKSVIYR